MTEQRTNPNENARRESSNQIQHAFLTKGRVSSSPEEQQEGDHHVSVQENGVTVDDEVPVLPQVHGDYYVPPPDLPVMATTDAKRNYYVVSSAVPDYVEKPSLKMGERVLSHPNSKTHFKWNKYGTFNFRAECHTDQPESKRNYPEINFKKDGSIEIIGDTGPNHKKQKIIYQPDGTLDVIGDTDVRINNGSIAAVTDVTIASTDKNGGATSLTIHRNDQVLLPSANTTTTSS